MKIKALFFVTFFSICNSLSAQQKVHQSSLHENDVMIASERIDKKNTEISVNKESLRKISESSVNKAKLKSHSELIKSISPLEEIEESEVKRSLNVNEENFQTPFDGLKNKREDISKRDIFSKHYVNDDGSFTALIGAGPMHYERNGEFLDIDTKIISSGDITYPFINTTNLFESHYAATSNSGVKNKTNDGEVHEFLNTYMYWEVDGNMVGKINSSNVNISVHEDKAYFNDIYGSIDVEFINLAGKRKLNYIIPDKQALGSVPEGAEYLVFSEDVVLPFGWSSSVTEKGVIIKNQLGQKIYFYENPVSIDAGNEITRTENTFFEISQMGNTLTIKTKVKASWLLESERIYPIKVDPTLNVYPQNSSWWTGFSYSDDDDYQGDMLVGRDTGFLVSGFARFNVSSIPVGSTITAATGFINRWGGSGNINNSARWQFRNCADPLVVIGLYSSMTVPLSPNTNIVSSGWMNSILNATGLTYIQNAISNGFFTLGIFPSETWNNNNYMYLDGYAFPERPYVTIDYVAPSCFAPSNVNVNSITANSAQLTWNAASPSPANGYQYYYNTTGVAPVATTTATGSVGAGVTTANISGLNPNTVYHVWVRSRCSITNTSVWVSGGYFNTNPGQECFQGDGQVRGPVSDGLGVNPLDVFRVADDFIVPADESFTISHISLEALSSSNVTNVTINIRSNNAGSPGPILNTVWNNTAPTTSVQYTTAFGFNTYHLTFNLATTYTYESGTYWVEVTMRNSNNTTVFWRSTVTGSTGAFCQNSGNSGTSWVENADGYDQVFYIAGECQTCEPIVATADEPVICEGEGTTLNVSSAGTNTYEWYLDYNSSTNTGTLIGTGSSLPVTPDESTLYAVVSDCGAYDFVSVAVVPPPSAVVRSPIEVDNCDSDEIIHELTVLSGGTIPEIAFSETFNPGSPIPWLVETSVSGGSGPTSASWGLYISSGTFHSNDNTNFAMVDSDDYGNFTINSKLISPAFSLADYSTASLTFYHYYRHRNSSGMVEISTDLGDSWTDLATYNSSDVGGPTNFVPVTINLDSYAGHSAVMIRFNYDATGGYYWAIDNVNVTGSPKPTAITWSPHYGLYTDEDATIPYTGEDLTTVYAMPEHSETYTVTATSSIGCETTAEIEIIGGISIWDGAAWVNNVSPNDNRKAVFRGDYSSTGDIEACSVQVDGGNVVINSGDNLIVHNGLNVVATASLTIESDANLLQINPAENTGDITVKRSANVPSNQYNFWSSPVAAQNMYDIYSNISNNTVMEYNTSNDFYYSLPNPTLSTFGIGYAIRGPSSGGPAITSSFVGVPHNETLTIPLNDVGQGFNLIGNPYPSNLNLQELYNYGTNNTNIEPTFYFWDNVGNTIFHQQGPGYSGINFAVYNANFAAGTQAASNPYASGKKPNGIVKPGQGFIVQAIAGSGIEVNNEMRTTALKINPSDDDAPYYKNGLIGEFDSQRPMEGKFWLELVNPNNIHIQIALGYFEQADHAFDKYDTPVVNESASDNLYSFSTDAEKLTINGRGPFTVEDVIPLGVGFYVKERYRIQLEDTKGIFVNHQNIYLKDKYLNLIHNLSSSPYEFESLAGEFTDRFEIVFKPEGFTNPAIENQISIVRQGSNILVSSSLDNIVQVELFNLAGWQVYKNHSVNSKEILIPATSFDNQIIVVTVLTEKGEKISQKLVNK